ncbi:MAG: imidazoleglycerol-phosphate dehydratase, partial [Candidatus Omnitrophica bacterium]|nr:imidazoleglycerol-phosphate dehydratase [Candidatus Omnitrophota bacterium]
MEKRKSSVSRRTRETDIKAKLNLDGKGSSKITTGIKFLDHMLELFTFHGFFDLELKAKGDLEVDLHHTNEDIGIVLADAFKKALGDKSGIRRFGSAFVPMDEALALVVADISGRPNLTLDISRILAGREKRKKEYSLNDAKQLLKAFSDT